MSHGAALAALAAPTLDGLFRARRLTPGQRRIASYILANPTEALFLSGSELAATTGVSQPSVTRFAQAVGFSGYSELVRALRRRLVEGPPAALGAGTPNKFQRALREQVATLEALDACLAQPEAIEKLGRDLAGSRPLAVLGLRASSALASYFAYFAGKVHPDVREIGSRGTGGTGPMDALLQAAQAGAAWVVCFLLPRYPRETLAAMAHARDLGMRVATVTDRASTEVARASDAVLVADVGTELVFDSQLAPMSVAAALVEAMCDADPARTQDRLEAFERVARDRMIFAADP